MDSLALAQTAEMRRGLGRRYGGRNRPLVDKASHYATHLVAPRGHTENCRANEIATPCFQTKRCATVWIYRHHNIGELGGQAKGGRVIHDFLTKAGNTGQASTQTLSCRHYASASLEIEKRRS